MCIGLVIQDFDQIRAYNNHETGQYSNKTKKAQQEQSKTFRVTYESTGVDNTDRQI